MHKRKQGSVNGSVSAPSTGVHTLGLDIGYGVTKAVTDGMGIAFPSVAGHARDICFGRDDLTNRFPGEWVEDEEGQWFIGDLALNQLPTGELLRLRGRTANETTMGNAFRVRLAKVAIGKLFGSGINRGDVVHLRLATGLPVDHMRDAAEMKASLLGQHIIRTDHADFIANVTEVMVMPQPLGTVYANMLTPTGEINVYHTFMRTGVCDVGTYTVDVALDDDGQFVDAESGCVESGVYTAQERIADMLERDYREKIPHKLVDQVLRTGIFTASTTARKSKMPCSRCGARPSIYSARSGSAGQPSRSSTCQAAARNWFTKKCTKRIHRPSWCRRRRWQTRVVICSMPCGAKPILDSAHEECVEAASKPRSQISGASYGNRNVLVQEIKA